MLDELVYDEGKAGGCGKMNSRATQAIWEVDASAVFEENLAGVSVTTPSGGMERGLIVLVARAYVSAMAEELLDAGVVATDASPVERCNPLTIFLGGNGTSVEKRGATKRLTAISSSVQRGSAFCILC